MNNYNHIESLVERLPKLESCKNDIINGLNIIIEAYEEGKQLLVCGNGGSNSDADHIIGELMKGFCKRRELSKELTDKFMSIYPNGGDDLSKLQTPLRAVNLSGNTSLSTAFGNDVDPVLSYAQQTLGYTNKGDVFLGISTSGNSKNIILAAVVAKAKGAAIISLTGRDGGELKAISDVCIVAPEYETYLIQELHLPVYHALCLEIEDYFFEC